MREILFRGKRLDNGEWVYGYIVKHGDRWWIYTGEIEYIYYPMLAENPEKIEVEPGTVCQYTGLTDKNGKKIFEGDIVKAPFLCGVTKRNITGIVEYKKGIFNFKHTEEEYGRQLLGYVDDIEVIGNIFEGVLTDDY